MTAHVDFNAFGFFIAASCGDANRTVGFYRSDEDEFEKCFMEGIAETLSKFGIAVVSVDDCDVMVAFATKLGMKGLQGYGTITNVLGVFKKSSANKLLLFDAKRTSANFRDKLLDINANLLDASILLPPGMYPPSSVRESLFILDKTREGRKKKDICFLDSTDLFSLGDLEKHMDGSAEAIAEIFDGFLDKGVREDFRDVLLKKEPIFPSYHYAKKYIEKVMEKPYSPLEECASLVRCPIFTNSVKSRQNVDESMTEIYCLSPKDFSTFGYTYPCAAEKKPFSHGFKKELFLKGHDILMVTQGNIGKLCIITPDFSETQWIGASFLWIIRAKSLDPRTLYLYLMSETVQNYLSRCSMSSGIPMLPVACFEQLPVPKLDENEQAAMVEAFIELENKRKEIFLIRKKAYSLLHTFYKINTK